MDLRGPGEFAISEAMPTDGFAPERTEATYPNLDMEVQALDFPGVHSLRDAAEVVDRLKAVARPVPGESERVVMGTLIPDRRLPNDVRALEHVLLRSVRRRFRIGYQRVL